MKPYPLPSSWPSLTPAGYFVIRQAPGYSYKKLVGSRLVKRKGKKRRVRQNVYKTITVKGRRVLAWVVQFPALRERWFNVADYQEGIENAREQEGFKVTQRDMEIFHSSPASDVIHTTEEYDAKGHSKGAGEPTLFVWRDKKLPTRLKVFGRKQPFRMVRIWFWIFHNDLEEYRIWCRSSTIYESNFKESWDFALKLYDQVVEDIADNERLDYLEVHGLVAWTAYTLGERARRNDRRRIEKESGGSR